MAFEMADMLGKGAVAVGRLTFRLRRAKAGQDKTQGAQRETTLL